MRRDTPSEHEQPWRAVLESSPLFGPAEERSFPWVQSHTTDELADRIASVSFVARSSPPRARSCWQVRAEVEELPQPFDFRYRTDVLVFRAPSGRADRAQARRVRRSRLQPGERSRGRATPGRGSAAAAPFAHTEAAVRSSPRVPRDAARVPADEAPARRSAPRRARGAAAVAAAVGDELGDALALEHDRAPGCAPAGRCAPASGPSTSSPFSTKRIPAQSQPPSRDERGDDRRRTSSASPPCVEDPRRPPRARRAHASNVRRRVRGTRPAPAPGCRASRSISTSVCFAVAISRSARRPRRSGRRRGRR